MTTPFEAVGLFNRKFGLPVAGNGLPGLLSDEEFLYKYEHLHEELHELLRAQRDRDLVGVADALADLVYVALGTAHFYGLPFDAVFAEVQRANLQKERATGKQDPRTKRRSPLDIVKPEGWRPPDIRGVIAAFVLDRGEKKGDEVKCVRCGVSEDDLLGTGERIAQRKEHKDAVLCDTCAGAPRV